MKRTYGKHRYTRSIANGVRLWLILVVLVSSIGPILVSADVVWSDDFNDGNYDGWTICENVTLASQWPTVDVGFNGSQWLATNSYLQLDQEGWGLITHPSNVAYGTWSFDFKANETDIGYGSRAEVSIIASDDWVTTGYSDPERFDIYIRFEVFTLEEPHNYTLFLRKVYNGRGTIMDAVWHVPVAGWHHIDVTRNTTGWFSVYHNGSLIMEGGDTDIDTSELFMAWFRDWHMIDNIVVNDEVISITSSTTTPPPFDWLPIGIGVSAVVIIVVLVIILKQRLASK